MGDRSRRCRLGILTKPTTPTQPGHPSVGRRNEYTGDGYGHRYRRNSDFCAAVGLCRVTRTVGALTYRITAYIHRELKKTLNHTFAKYDRLTIFLPRDTRSSSALLLSKVVRPSVRLSVTLMYPGHIGWNSSKSITGIISLGSSLLGATTSAI